MKLLLIPILSLVMLCGCAPKEKEVGVYPIYITTNQWSKWGEPKITSDMWLGTSVWQTRTNFDTG